MHPSLPYFPTVMDERLFFQDGSLLPWRSSLFIYFLFLVESSDFLFSVGFSILTGKECFVLLCPYNSRWQSYCPFSVSISYYTLPSDRLCTQDSPTLEFLYHLNSRTLSLSYWGKDQVCFLCSDISLLVFCAIVLLVNTVGFLFSCFGYRDSRTPE